MKETSEQLNHLIRQFADKQIAREMAGDILQADQLLATIPSPTVSQQRLGAIKAQVRAHLTAKDRLRMKVWLTSAAAAILLIGSMTLIFKTDTPTGPTQTGRPPAVASYLWNGNSESEDDPVASLTARIEMAASQLDSVQEQTASWFDDESTLTVEMQDIQTVVINTDFWKG